jgi:biotin-dependent carboxylase-like uncharacterized protein
MSHVIVQRGGLQTSLQGAPRIGYRHLGVPVSGPADALSMALANRLVGNVSFETALETTLTGADVMFSDAGEFAVTGADTDVVLNGRPVRQHEMLMAASGDVLEIGASRIGCRNYLAVNGGFEANSFLGSTSTYLPAKLGGHHGRVLHNGDEIAIKTRARNIEQNRTPPNLIPAMTPGTALQATPATGFEMLTKVTQQRLFAEPFQIGQRASRMGVELSGAPLDLPNLPTLPSSAVFPGALQCPPSGAPFLLLADAQTTGGYLYALQVARVDLHQLGQLRPNANLRFLRRTPRQAIEARRAQLEALSDWLTLG